MKSRMRGISTKVTASSLGTAVALIALWLIPGREPVAVASAFVVVFTFICGFITPENTPIERVDA